MNITVFGGSGFVGSHVCDKLSEAGHNVTIFDIKISNWLRVEQKMVKGDILDSQAVEQAVKGSEAVFNFAGIADIGDAGERPVDTVRYNILGNAIILEACRKASVQRYIFASTVYVYSKAGGFYRCSKQACEAYIESYNENFGLAYTILRYGSLYGPRSGGSNAIYRFIEQAMREKRIAYPGSRDALREYIHVEDAAESSVEMLKPEYANQSIVLTGHQPMKVEHVMKMIAEIINGDIRIEFSPNKEQVHYEITPYTFSPKIGKKITPMLHIDLGQGILQMIEEVHQKINPDLKDTNGMFLKETK